MTVHRASYCRVWAAKRSLRSIRSSSWWKAQQLCPTQQREISRLEKQLERLHTTIDAILSLAEQLKEAAIEKVLGKSALREL